MREFKQPPMHTPTPPLPTRRADLIHQLQQGAQYDLAVIGGGATGLGVALDAAQRGYRVLLLEGDDFAKGTSSRSTKLVHGGVRYLAQGNIALVREALHERTALLKNAPYIAQPLAFIMPTRKWWERAFYGMGLKLYDLLAGKAGLGKTHLLSKAATLAHLPTLLKQGLKGGVKYWDGQFNDARLALALARTAAQHGALLINYCRATELIYKDAKIVGLQCQDVLTGQQYPVHAACVVNATGVWVDAMRIQDGTMHQAAGGRPIKPMVAPSQGVHIVVDQEFLETQNALMVPKTEDGRVLFAVPWLGKVILGTTDTPRTDLDLEPLALAEEIQFILREAGKYLRKAPTERDIRSIWVGLRPLVKAPDDDREATKTLSREHTVLVSRTGLVTVTGGKWTTYRAMAQDVIAKCLDKALLQAKKPCQTETLALVGVNPTTPTHVSLSLAAGLHSYGDEASFIQTLEGAHTYLSEGFSEAMVRFAARYEYAITVEDVLARRSRLLFLDAELASQLAPQVAQLLQSETGIDPRLSHFLALAKQYLQIPSKNI